MHDSTIEYTLRLGDDALLLGHRVSEWTSHAPFLEEELGLANVALDFIGRARLFYAYAAALAGQGRTEDDYAYRRDEHEFKNLLLMELPRGDFAFTIVRQFLVDSFHMQFLPALAESGDETLAAIGAKTLKESTYHLRRSREWMLRLGDGTEESHYRTQRALDELWAYTDELFAMDPLEQRLSARGIAVERASLAARWTTEVESVLAQATLTRPLSTWSVNGGRAGIHTEHLGHLLTELQCVQRRYPGAQW